MFRNILWMLRWVVPESPLDFLGIQSLTNARVASEIESMIEESASFPIIDASRWGQLSESLEGNPYELRLIYKSKQTGVYAVEMDGEHRVLVYRQYCASGRHPQSSSLRDYWFLKHLEHTGLVPQVHAVSAPFRAPENSTGKVDWRENSEPEVRYVLSGRIIGRSLLEIVSRGGEVVQQPLAVAVRYAIQMIQFIEKIHRQNVIHGDAQFGNFMVFPESGEYLSLIDYERAAIFNEFEVLETPCVYEEGAPFVLGVWVSPWEARMCAKSFRDDIHRIFMTLAVMMYGHQYLNYQAALATGAVRAYDVHGMEMEREYVVMTLRNIWMAQRQAGEIFVLSSDRLDQTLAQFGIVRLGARLTTEFIPAISVRDKFRELEKSLIEMRIDERPDYALIKQVLLDIVHLVE